MKGRKPSSAGGKGPGRSKRARRRPATAVERPLDDELARLAAEESSAVAEDTGPAERTVIAREILDVFFNIWIRFAVDLGRELRMSPWQWDFAIYDGGKSYRFRDSFNFERVREAVLEESAFPFRHALRGELARMAGKTYVRVSFVLEEGRRFDGADAVAAKTSYLIYNVPAGRFTARNLKKALAEPLRAWIRSEVRGDPSVLWDFCHEKLRRGL